MKTIFILTLLIITPVSDVDITNIIIQEREMIAQGEMDSTIREPSSILQYDYNMKWFYCPETSYENNYDINQYDDNTYIEKMLLDIKIKERLKDWC